MSYFAVVSLLRCPRWVEPVSNQGLGIHGRGTLWTGGRSTKRGQPWIRSASSCQVSKVDSKRKHSEDPNTVMKVSAIMECSDIKIKSKYHTKLLKI